jgi:L-asparaginase
MAIRLFVTGGTFDKEYDEIRGRLYFQDTHLPQMLEMGRCRVDVEIRTLMMVDSLDMTDADRELIARQCRTRPRTGSSSPTAPTPWWTPPPSWPGP